MPMEPFENESNFQEDVGMFEAATHAGTLVLPTPRVQVVHLALDGSNQDDTARALAQAVAERLQARVHEQTGAADANEILARRRAEQADLLVIPVPFGRDFLKLGMDSLGSVIDMLLRESPCPLLCVREHECRASGCGSRARGGTHGGW